MSRSTHLRVKGGVANSARKNAGKTTKHFPAQKPLKIKIKR